MEYRNIFDFSGRTVLITGGTGTIGSEFARAFASCGADVVISGRDQAKAENVIANCIPYGVKASFIKCDLSNIYDIEQMVDRAADRLGKLDILCNHGGISVRRPVFECTESDWDRLIGIDLKAPFFAAKKAARIMSEKGYGRIINTASVSSARGHKNLSIYAAAKGGLSQMTKVLANEWAEYGITVNAVAPGYVLSGQTDCYLADNIKKSDLLSKIPLGRFCEPYEIAAAALFLASTGGAYITGQTIYIDGGRLID